MRSEEQIKERVNSMAMCLEDSWWCISVMSRDESFVVGGRSNYSLRLLCRAEVCMQLFSFEM